MTELRPHETGYARLVDRYSRYIESPVLRLRFLNNALKLAPTRGWITRIPLAGSLPDRAMLIFELSKSLSPMQRIPVGLRLTALAYRLRYAVYGAGLIGALAGLAGIVYVASKITATLSISSEARGIGGNDQQTRGTAAAEAVGAIGSKAGLSPEKVWLAERGDGFEFYSNGARILTGFETRGRPRLFYEFATDGSDGQDPPTVSKPVGIVYHVSESDQLPFSDRYNSSLLQTSRSLLEYARDQKLYNYVIDRFGRIYRIVVDEEAANHAGNSMWGDDRHIYINLSASFIGVCFEGRSGEAKAVGPDEINEAQIYAARALTMVLRSKYGISDSNCVTHGLVSVNPSNKLMGYHTDWVAGFPFEALGLSNKYQSELVAVSRFGFSYDAPYIAAAGGRKWPGLERAEESLGETAAKDGVTVRDERRSQWRAFQSAFSKQRELDRSRAADEK
jgi:N-acetylmuramoyl-L-alanine amidase